MRGWAILLGAATSLVLLLFAVAFRHYYLPLSIPLCLAAAPPFLFHLLPVLVARLRSDPTPVRVGVTETSALAPVRYRIAESQPGPHGTPEGRERTGMLGCPQDSLSGAGYRAEPHHEECEAPAELKRRASVA
jgi:hypothetical protein